MTWIDLLQLVGLLILALGVWNITGFTAAPWARDAAKQDSFGGALFFAVLRSSGWRGVARTYGCVFLGSGALFGPTVFRVAFSA